MTYSEDIKKEFMGLNKKDIINLSILVGIVIISIILLPISTNQAFSSMKEQINNAKTCSDVFNADQVPFGASTMIEMFDTNNSIKNLIDSKAHQLCKPLYDLEKKYGDLRVNDVSKMSCSDLGILIKTIPTRQEVINQYVSQCSIDKQQSYTGVKQ